MVTPPAADLPKKRAPAVQKLGLQMYPPAAAAAGVPKKAWTDSTPGVKKCMVDHVQTIHEYYGI